MEAFVTDYLYSVRVKKEEPCTHGSMEPAGRYYIGEGEKDVFWKLYCGKVRKGKILTITEIPKRTVMPLRVDFDFKAPLEVGTERQYTEDMVKQLVEWYQEELRNSIDESVFEEEMLTCLVLEKSAPREDEEAGIIKDGFHLHFPHFACEGWFQDDYLRGKLVKKMKDEGVWSECTFKAPKGKDLCESIIDKLGNKPWLMYGSAKSLAAEPYLFSRAYNGDQLEVELADVFATEMGERQRSVEYYLPQFLSLLNCGEAIDLKAEIKPVVERKKKRRLRAPSKKLMEEQLRDIKLIKEAELMEMLSDDRADNYDEWMEVGWALYNIAPDCDDSLQMWIDFSRKSAKFVEGVCEEKWEKMKMGGMTIGTIKMMAKKDSPDLYNAWRRTDVRSCLFSSLREPKPNEGEVAQVVVNMYKDRFVCAVSRQDEWYEFKGHRWRQVDDSIPLKKLLASEVKDQYIEVGKELLDAQSGGEGAEKGSKEEGQSKRCQAMITALKTVQFMEKVIKMCKMYFHDSTFMKRLDKNKKLFVCENGVLDLELGVFRDGRPDDYMTTSCERDYVEYSKTDEEVQDLKKIFRQIYTNPNRRKYFMRSSSLCMEGGNITKTFLLHTGGGSNAKTVAFALLEDTFGCYCCTVPRELLVEGKTNSSGSARPELARLEGKRLVFAPELGKNEKFNLGVLKALTGGDPIYFRKMYKGSPEKDMDPTFTLMGNCNEPPDAPVSDEAFWDRFRVLDYDSVFVLPKNLDKLPVPEDEEEQFRMRRFKADPRFKDKIKDYASVFLWMLFRKYKKYRNMEDYVEPEEVKHASAEFRQNSDVMMKFKAEKIREVKMVGDNDEEVREAPRPFIRLTDMYAEFSDWYREEYPHHYRNTKISKVKLKHELEKHLGPIDIKSRWVGYEIIGNADDDDDEAIEKHFG